MTEKLLTNKKNGMAMLLLFLAVIAAAAVAIIVGANLHLLGLIVAGVIVISLIWIPMIGRRILKPQEALVLTLFGRYYGTLKGEGYYYVKPFCTGVNPAAKTRLSQSGDVKTLGIKATTGDSSASLEVDTTGKKLSLKIMTLSNNRQKINDCLGNPVEIGIAVTWRIIDTAKAVFNVDNYKEFLSLQCDSALRNIVRLYPYDVAPNVDTTGDGIADDGSLRGSSELVASRIRGAPRKMIVEGAVGMVEMALERLSESGMVELDEERKAAMVSNLLVVLCGNHDAQPVVNSGSLY